MSFSPSVSQIRVGLHAQCARLVVLTPSIAKRHSEIIVKYDPKICDAQVLAKLFGTTIVMVSGNTEYCTCTEHKSVVGN